MLSLCLNLLLRSALILLPALLLRRALPPRRAYERHRILFAAFLLLLLWPLASLAIPQFSLPFFQPANTSAQVAASDAMFLTVRPEPSGPFVYWPALLWLTGVAASLAPVAAGLFRAHQLAQHASSLDDPEWRSLLQSLCRDFRIACPSLLLLPQPALPFTFGLRHPKILLPADCLAWTALRRRSVLAHELAHIQRRDLAKQLLANLVTAIWWFQPFTRVAFSALRHESELACDAIALSSGIGASDYAAELLHLAKAARPLPVVLMMARPKQLEQRVLAVLDQSITRSRRFVSLFAVAFLVLLTISSASIALNATTPQKGSIMQRTLLSGLLTTAGLSAATIGGSLLDSTGAAVPGAKASLYNPDTSINAETSTAADGKFSFAVPAGQYILHIQKPGFASLFREFSVQTDSKVERGLTLIGADQHQVRVGGETQQNKLIQKVQPVYPASAKEAHLQGQVLLEAVISADGIPEDIKVLSSPGDDLAQSALEAVRQWRYSTTLLNGEPISVLTDIVVHYTLTR